MKGSIRFSPAPSFPAIRLLLAALMLLAFCAAANADETPEETEWEEGGETIEVQEDPPVIPAGTYSQAEVMGGYKTVSSTGSQAGTSPYARLRSGVTGGLLAAHLSSSGKFLADAAFLSADDFHAELLYDYKGLARFMFESTALWHETERYSLTPGSLSAVEHDASRLSYGFRTIMENAQSRFKFGDLPAHIALGYSMVSRDGTSQVRYSDYFFSPGDSIRSASVKIDSASHEGSVGLDAHLGPINADYLFRITEFINHAGSPTDTFSSRAGVNSGGSQKFAEPVESRVLSNRFQVSTDLSGGLVSSASYSVSVRENTSTGTVTARETPRDTLQKIAGDLTWIPRGDMTMALRFRRLQIDRTSPEPLSSLYATSVSRYETPDRESDTITLSGLWKPLNPLSLNLEYNLQHEARRNGTDWNGAIDSEYIGHKGKASLHWRPHKGIRSYLTYEYSTQGQKDYASLPDESHKGTMYLSYTNTGTWGFNLSYSALRQQGTSPVQGTSTARNSLSRQPGIGFWFSPLPRLVLSGNYSYLQYEADQQILFNSDTLASLTLTNYHSNAHVWSVEASYSPTERLDISAAYQEVRSDSGMAPDYNSFSSAGSTFDTTGLEEASRFNTTDRSVSARIAWNLTRHFGCSFDYLFRDYSAETSSLDGRLHSGTVSLKARW